MLARDAADIQRLSHRAPLTLMMRLTPKAARRTLCTVHAAALQVARSRRHAGGCVYGPWLHMSALHPAQRRWRYAVAEKRPFRRLPRSRCAVGCGGQHGRRCDPRRVR
jgi:hypothetical protein